MSSPPVHGNLVIANQVLVPLPEVILHYSSNLVRGHSARAERTAEADHRAVANATGDVLHEAVPVVHMPAVGFPIEPGCSTSS